MGMRKIKLPSTQWRNRALHLLPISSSLSRIQGIGCLFNPLHCATTFHPAHLAAFARSTISSTTGQSTDSFVPDSIAPTNLNCPEYLKMESFSIDGSWETGRPSGKRKQIAKAPTVNRRSQYRKKVPIAKGKEFLKQAKQKVLVCTTH